MTPDLDALDRMAAEKIMGWCEYSGYWRFAPSGICEIAKYNTGKFNVNPDTVLWQPTRRIEHAWELLEKVKPPQIQIKYDEEYGIAGKTGWNVTISWNLYETWSITPAEAITRACLRASGVEI